MFIIVFCVYVGEVLIFVCTFGTIAFESPRLISLLMDFISTQNYTTVFMILRADCDYVVLIVGQ